ncbi:MAG: ribonuclease HII [Parachlamydiaceae bacterium]|nr:ribonuclease HII [Parachlamydiaceae bacterium]
MSLKIDPSERSRLKKMTQYELEGYSQGYQFIAGVDEAGRGPLAGPVVAAACILPKGLLIPKIDDSKKLTPEIRAELYTFLTNHSQIHFGIGIVSSLEIDQINIYQATHQAMRLAIQNLFQQPDYLLVDGKGFSHSSVSCLNIVKGDQFSQSIAAASIIAKETRDGLMIDFNGQWPQYGFDQHKGYGTPKHKEALSRHGPCPIHRMSFEPCALASLFSKN